MLCDRCKCELNPQNTGGGKIHFGREKHTGLPVCGCGFGTWIDGVQQKLSVTRVHDDVTCRKCRGSVAFRKSMA